MSAGIFHGQSITCFYGFVFQSKPLDKIIHAILHCFNGCDIKIFSVINSIIGLFPYCKGFKVKKEKQSRYDL